MPVCTVEQQSTSLADLLFAFCFCGLAKFRARESSLWLAYSPLSTIVQQLPLACRCEDRLVVCLVACMHVCKDMLRLAYASLSHLGSKVWLAYSPRFLSRELPRLVCMVAHRLASPFLAYSARSASTS